MGAMAMTKLAELGNSRIWVLGLVALLEPIVLTRLPSRQRLQSVEPPSAMMQIEGPILSLYPDHCRSATNMTPIYFFTALSCLFQVSHQQPIADNCVSVDVSQQPRAVLGRWVHQRLMAGEGHAVRSALSSLGFSALAFHPDLYSEGDSIRLQAGLEAVHSDPAESKDGGIWTQIFPLDGKGIRPEGWTPLPSPTVSIWGAQSRSVPLQRLLVGLMPEDGQKDYQLTVQADNKTLGIIPFRDLLQGRPSDFRWSIVCGVDGSYRLSLVLTVTDDQDTVYWEGDF